MANCILETPISQIADDFDKKVLGKYMPTKTKDNAEAKERFQFYDKNFELRDAEAEKRGYGVIGHPTITKETFTSEASKKFEKVKGKIAAKEISERPDNVILRDTGINMHSTIKDLTYYHVHNTHKEHADTALDYADKKSLETIKRESGLGDNQFAGVERMVKQMIHNAVERQKEIDPTQKVLLAPEQKLIKSRDLGGTADLVVVYSNQNHSTYDYKTLYPRDDKTFSQEAQEYRINDPTWIDFYHYVDWTMQLPKINEALRDGMKLGGRLENSRIIPIHLEFVKVKKDGKTYLTPNVTQVRTFADGDDFLEQIPIQEKTGDKKLDVDVNNLLTLRHNIQADLEKEKNSEKETYYKERLDRITVTINKLIVSKDVKSLMSDYAKVIRKFGQMNNMKAVTGLKEGLGDVSSKDYMDISNLLDLKDDLGIFSSIMDNSGDFYEKLNIKEPLDSQWLSASDMMRRNAGLLTSMVEQEITNRLMYSERELDRAANFPRLNFLSKALDTYSEFKHPVFEKSFLTKQRLKDAYEIVMERSRKELYGEVSKYQQWAQRNGHKNIYEPLINKETGTLHYKTTLDFVKQRNEAFANKLVR